MDKKTYTNYTAERLLLDDFFWKSTLHPDKESQLFWEELAANDEQLSEEIATARFILASVGYAHLEKPLLSSGDKENVWKQIEGMNRRRDKWKRLRTLSIAASVAAAIAWGAIWGYRHAVPETDYQAIIRSTPWQTDVAGKIQLVLSDNQTLSVDGKEAEIDYQNKGEVMVNAERIDVEERKNEQQQVFNQLIVPIGKRSSLIFSDGTRIWVNSDSKVVYPVQFSPDKREIFIEGEVYLNVVARAEAPFIVKTRQMDITVLGTQFNVSTYGSEHQTDVVLVKGKIEVKTQENKKNILSPNQRFTYDTTTREVKIDYVDVDNYIAWKEGYYPFQQQPLDVVLKKLIKYYGVKMEWDAAIGAQTCSGKLDLKDDLREVLKVLTQATPVAIEENENHIRIHVKP